MIRVTGEGGSYQGVLVSGRYGSCGQVLKPGYVSWKGLTGSGFSYDGEFSWYYNDDCSPAGEGPLTVTLSSIDEGTVHSSSPVDSGSFTSAISRIGKWPGGGQQPDTTKAQPCYEGGKPVLCPQQASVVQRVKAQALAVKRLYEKLKKEKGKLDQVKKLEKQFGEQGRKAAAGAGLWEKANLPKTAAAAQGRFRNAQLAELFKFQEELKKLANYRSVILAKADAYQAAHAGTEPQTALDALAELNYGSAYRYSSLTPDQQLVVASQAQQVTGALDRLILMMQSAGKSATRVTFAR